MCSSGHRCLCGLSYHIRQQVLQIDVCFAYIAGKIVRVFRFNLQCQCTLVIHFVEHGEDTTQVDFPFADRNRLRSDVVLQVDVPDFPGVLADEGLRVDPRRMEVAGIYGNTELRMVDSFENKIEVLGILITGPEMRL